MGFFLFPALDYVFSLLPAVLHTGEFTPVSPIQWICESTIWSDRFSVFLLPVVIRHHRLIPGPWHHNHLRHQCSRRTLDHSDGVSLRTPVGGLPVLRTASVELGLGLGALYRTTQHSNAPELL